MVVDFNTEISALDCDIRGLKLSAAEAFVLSRIEGKTSLQDLAESLGMPFEQAQAIVDRLAELRAVRLEEPGSRYSTTFRPRTSRKARPAPSRATQQEQGATRDSGDRVGPAPRAGCALPVPPPDEPGKISAALARKIAELDSKLGTSSDWALLGLEEGASEREITRAFGKLAYTFDPSHYFGINVGPYMEPLERIFARLAAAQESLLAKMRPARHTQAAPAIAQSPKVPVTSDARRRSAKPSRSQKSSKPPSGSDRAPKAKSRSRRLQAVKPQEPKAPAAASACGGDAEAYARASEQAYQRDKREQQRAADVAKAATFVDAARAAESRGDVVAAAQHYKLALQVVDDDEVRRSLGRIHEEAQALVYKAAVRQGEEAERAEKFATAAVRYRAAYDIIPEPRLADRIAHALLRDGKDVRRALHLAEEAVMGEPRNAHFRLTLAQACRMEGLLTRAAGEAERARALAPGDARVLELIARLHLETPSGSSGH